MRWLDGTTDSMHMSLGMRGMGFSLQWPLVVEHGLSGHTGFSSCGSRALERKLSSCGTRA